MKLTTKTTLPVEVPRIFFSGLNCNCVNCGCNCEDHIFISLGVDIMTHLNLDEVLLDCFQRRENCSLRSDAQRKACYADCGNRPFLFGRLS